MSIQISLKVVVLLLLGLASVAFGAEPSPIPFDLGTQWTYEGQASWTVADSNTVKSGRVRWTTTVLESREIPGGRAAIVSGWPADLAWYEPGQDPELSVLIIAKNKVFQLSMESDHAARQVMDRLQDGSTIDYEDAEPLLDLPLARFKKWANDEYRTDDMYCWVVTGELPYKSQFPGFPSTVGSKRYTVVYRSLPDDQTLEFVPGLGIVRFAYRHHGTVAHTDVSLVAFQQGGSRP